MAGVKARELPDKTCERCGRTYNRTRQSGGALESAARYAQRRYCSRRCAKDKGLPAGLVESIVKDWKAGFLSRPEIARKHGVPVAMVNYRTRDVARAPRPAAPSTVRVECADCGDVCHITRDALKKRERENRGPFRCRWCVNAWRKTPSDADRLTKTEVARWACDLYRAMPRHQWEGLRDALDELEPDTSRESERWRALLLPLLEPHELAVAVAA